MKLTKIFIQSSILISGINGLHSSSPGQKESRLRTLLDEKFDFDTLFSNQVELEEPGITSSSAITLDDDAETNPFLQKVDLSTCRSKCATHKRDRLPCGKPIKNSSAEKICKKKRCCYDAEDGSCYQQASSYCPNPVCESVPINLRSHLPGDSAITCSQCWDPKRSTCFREPLPKCAQTPVNQRSQCGWDGITKNHCKLQYNCCWDEADGICFNAIVDLPSENLSSIKVSDAIQNDIQPIIMTNTGPSPQCHAPIINEVREDLYVCAMDVTQQECEQFNCCWVKYFGFDACFQRIPEKNEVKINEEASREHSSDGVIFPDFLNNNEERIELTPELLPEETPEIEEVLVAPVTTTAAPTEENVSIVANSMAPTTTNIPTTSATIDHNQAFARDNGKFYNYARIRDQVIPKNDVKEQAQTLDLILAQEEAKQRCEESFPDITSKNFKRCVLFRLPSLIDRLNSDSDISLSLDDKTLTRNLKLMCLSNIDSNELCKVIALSGRPIKSIKNNQIYKFLNFNVEQTPLANLMNEDLEEKQVLPLVLQGINTNDPETTNLLLQRLAKLKSSESFEAAALTRLLTEVSYQDNLPEIDKTCYNTLLVNNIDISYSQYSYTTSDARVFEDQQSCENAGHCWTDYNLDSIVSEAYANEPAREAYTKLFMFSQQLDRILGNKPVNIFRSKCIKKASSSFVTMTKITSMVNY